MLCIYAKLLKESEGFFNVLSVGVKLLVNKQENVDN